MTALIKRTICAFIVILMMPPPDVRAMTATMVATSVQPGYQSLIVNTLLLGAVIPFLEVFEEKQPDPTHFHDKTPDMENEEDANPLWLWLLKKLQYNPELTEADAVEMLTNETLADAEAFVDHITDLSVIQSFDQQQTVPGVRQFGGGDGHEEQKKESSADNSDEKKMNDEDKSDEGSDASATSSDTSPSSSLQVIKEDIRPQITAALKRYNEKEETCRELVQGGYSRVYKVTEDGIVLVIKAPCLPPEESYKTKEAFEREKQRLLNMSSNEKEILLKLQHENIIKLFAYIEIEIPELGKTLLLIMEYAGKELSHYLWKNFDAIKNHLLFIAHNILEGLYYIHRQGLVWGELKSSNVMVSRHNQQISIRLIDMATCQTSEQRALMKFDDVYTLDWQAPELFPYTEGRVVTGAADVYHFGLICAMLRQLHRHCNFLIREEFKQSRRRNPGRINGLILSTMKDSVNWVCGLTDNQLESSGNPGEQAIQRLKSGSFLHLMAALATRAIEWRPSAEEIRRYFDFYDRKPLQ